MLNASLHSSSFCCSNQEYYSESGRVVNPLILALSQEAGTGYSLNSKPGLQSEFEESQGNREKTCHENKQTDNNKRIVF